MAKLSFSLFFVTYNFIGEDMKKYYQYFSLALIMVFSFYYTEKIANIVLNKNPLMQEINASKNKYEIQSVNATIDGNYIIPGLNGLEVNTKESFYKMQDINTFNSYYLVYKQVKPNISLQDNKDKIIRNGNPKLKKVSLILETENDISNYLKTNNIPASVLINLNNYTPNNYFELINNDYNNFKELENNLNLHKENTNICVINSKNLDMCIKYHHYLVESTFSLDSTNISEIKSNLSSGSIILIKNTAKLSDLKMLIKEINFKGLEIVNLSQIISEEYIY